MGLGLAESYSPDARHRYQIVHMALLRQATRPYSGTRTYRTIKEAAQR